MNKRKLISLASLTIALLTGKEVAAQSYSNAVVGLNPVAYWPLSETTQPPAGAYIATNIGTLGAAGNGFYETWFQPWNTGTNTLYYQTNNIQHVAGAIADGDTALNCTRSAAGAGGYVVFPRTTNGVPNTGITLTPPFSIEFWAKPSSATTAVMPIVTEGRNPSQQDQNFGYASTNWSGFCIGQYGTIFFFATFNGRGGDATKQELDAKLATNVWQHLVVTFNGTNQTWYTNGVQASTRAIPASAANQLGQLYVPDLTSPLLIGSGSIIGAGNGGSEFAGSIDEVAIYTNLLDPTAIANHFAAAAGSTYQSTVLADNPTIYVRLGEPAFSATSYPSPDTYPIATNYGVIGATANGRYQPGTAPGVSGPPFAGFGPSSRAVAINGYSGAVDVGGGNLPPELNPTNKAALTVAGWFQGNPADAPARFQEIVGHGNSSWRIAMDSTAGGLRFNPGNNPELQFANSADIVTNGFLVNDGKWHFVAGVSDGTNDSLYIDGVLARTATGVGAITGSTLDALLGGDPGFLVPVYNGSVSAQPRYFDGQIAHIAFFTNALSAAQIQDLYSAAGVPPNFWQTPVSTTNNAGANVTISAGAHGSAPLSYQWYKNGVAVSSQTNANLTYAPSDVSNSGDYYVIVTNNYGAITSSVVTLFLYGAPVIQQQSLTDIRVFAGASPTLRITASGAQPILYQWSLNGNPIANATNSSYTISNAQTGGTYTCAISNSVGVASPAFSPVTLTVVPDPTAPYPAAVLASAPTAFYRLDESPDNGSGNVGTTAYDNSGGYNAVYNNVLLAQPGYNNSSDPSDFAVEFGDFPPNNNYAGNVPAYLNFGTPNGSNAQFSVEAWITEYLFLGGGNAIVAVGYGNGGEQFVLDTGASAQGALRFFVRNAAGTVSAASSSYVPANDGLWHHVVGVCDEAAGQVRLYMDGTQIASGAITPGSGLLNATTPLTIGARESANNIPATNDFQFLGKIDEVAVYNRALSATEVQNHYFASGIPPTILQLQPSTVETNQGATVTFTVTATGTGPLTYQWYDPSSALLSSTSNVLVLSNVQQNQSGSYMVVVSNPYGSPVSTNATLTVDIGAPQISVDLQPTNLTAYVGDSLTYSVVASGSTPMQFQWYKNGVAVNNATNSSYTFAALTGTNTYYVSVTNAFSYSQLGGPTYSSTGTVAGVTVPTLNPSSYSYNATISFPGYNRGETLRDFPVLVKFGTNINGFAYSQLAPDGGDLRFTDATGTREIPHEIDEWNPNGISTVWVQVPRLTGTNDVIKAYWGNPSETTPLAWSTNGGVWVPPSFENLPGYQVVYHMKEAALPFADASQQHPATNGVAPAQTNGIVGTAGSFDGTDWLDAGTNDVGDTFTLSAWLNIPTGTSDIQTVWANAEGGFAKPGFALFINTYHNSDQKIDFSSGNGTAGNESTSAANTVPFGGWHQVTVSVNRTNGTAQFYVDGNNAGSTTSVVKDFRTLNDLSLGEFVSGSFGMHGAIDEARIQTGVNSTNWVWASWATVAQNSTFENYSSVNSSIVTISVQHSGNNLILTWPEGTLQSAPQVTGTYTDVIGATSPYTNSITGPQLFYRLRIP